MAKHWRALVLIVALALAGFVNLQTAGSASAKANVNAPRAPFVARSYYVDSNFLSVRDVNGNVCPNCYADQLGRSDAQAENNLISQQGMHCQQAQWIVYTVLDFGSPRDGYAETFSGQTMSWGDGWGNIASITQSYANGWYMYSYNCFVLDLLIGVSNSYICGNLYESQPCDGTAGGELANDVNTLNNDLASINESWQILGKGGFDAEAYYGSGDLFGSYAATRDLAQGYNNYLFNNHVGWNLYDFGDAGSNCNGPVADWCNSGPGLAGNVYTIAWGMGYDEAFPEAYFSGSNWTGVNSYSSSGQANQGPIQYNVVMLDGSQSQSSECNEWQTWIQQDANYIPNSPFYGSVQQPMGGPYQGFFHC